MEPTTRTTSSKGGLFEDADARDVAEDTAELENELLPDTRSVLMQTVPVHQHTRKVMQKIVNLLKGLSRKLQTQEDALMAIETAVEVLISHRPHITASLNRIKARLSAPDGTATYGPKIPSHHQTNAEIHAKVRERVQAKLSEAHQTKQQSPDVVVVSTPSSQLRVANETPTPASKIAHESGPQISTIEIETQVYAEQLQGSVPVHGSSSTSSKSTHEVICKEVNNTSLARAQSTTNTSSYEMMGDKIDSASGFTKTVFSKSTPGEGFADTQAGHPGGRDIESKGGYDIPQKQRILKTQIVLKPDVDTDKDKISMESTTTLSKTNNEEKDAQPTSPSPSSPPLFGHNMGTEVTGRDYNLANLNRSTAASHVETSGNPWRQSLGITSVLNTPDHRSKQMYQNRTLSHELVQMAPLRRNAASPQQHPISTSYEFSTQRKFPTLEDAFDLNLPIPPGYEQFEYEYDGDKRELHTGTVVNSQNQSIGSLPSSTIFHIAAYVHQSCTGKFGQTVTMSVSENSWIQVAKLLVDVICPNKSPIELSIYTAKTYLNLISTVSLPFLSDFTPEESLHIAKYIQMIVYNSTKEATSMLDTRVRYKNTHSTFRSGAPGWK